MTGWTPEANLVIVTGMAALVPLVATAPRGPGERWRSPWMGEGSHRKALRLAQRLALAGNLALLAVIVVWALSAALAVTGAEIGELSASDVAAGISRLAASGALARASAELEQEAEADLETAASELIASEELGQVSKAATTEAVVSAAGV